MKKQAILYGAGPQNLRIPYETLIPAGYEIKYLVDKDTKKIGTTWYDILIISLEELKEYDKSTDDYYLIITVRNKSVVEEIKKELSVLQHAEIYTFEKFFYEKKVRYNEKNISVVMLHLTDHCNLNCVRCSHYSPLVKEPSFLSLDAFKKDLERLYSFTGDTIPEIQLMGGEPLLHPQCAEFFPIVRKKYKKTILTLITNGLLIPKMKPEFFEACRKNDVLVSISYYGAPFDYQNMENILIKEKIRYIFGNEVDYKNHKGKLMEKCFPLNLNGGMDGEDNFRKCILSTPTTLRDGKLYNCCICAYVEFFNDYFGTSLPQNAENGIDMYEVNSYEELMEKLCENPPLCNYCKLSDTTDAVRWSVSECDIREWTV